MNLITTTPSRHSGDQAHKVDFYAPLRNKGVVAITYSVIGSPSVRTHGAAAMAKVTPPGVPREQWAYGRTVVGGGAGILQCGFDE